MKRLLRSIARCFLLMVVLSHLLLPDAARAGVLQQVVVFQDMNGMVVNGARDEVFGITSADITRNIGAQIGSFPALGYQATSSASQFGSVGLSAALTGGGVVSVFSSVFVASDEFVNLTGVPQRATANFIIDGGSMFVIAGRNARATYDLSLIGANLGNVSIETDQSRFKFLPIGSPGFPFLPEFLTSGVLEADASGNLSFISNGEDIGATFSPPGLVEIPLSFQSFDLGIVNPGDRLYLEYEFSLSTEVGTVVFPPDPNDPPLLTPGVAEGIFAGFSDPFNLAGHPVLPTITLQPLQAIPEPSTFVLLCLGALVPLGCAWRGHIRETGRRLKNGFS